MLAAAVLVLLLLLLLQGGRPPLALDGHVGGRRVVVVLLGDVGWGQDYAGTAAGRTGGDGAGGSVVAGRETVAPSGVRGVYRHGYVGVLGGGGGARLAAARRAITDFGVGEPGLVQPGQGRPAIIYRSYVAVTIYYEN